ncbi:MAG: OsmC family peroxiredoxin [Caldilineaceae bacterium]
MAVSNSEATWNGSLKEGAGTMKVGTSYEGPFTFASRFETGPGTNPEELIGAAHAGCYSMFLSALLGNAKYTPNSINTKAEVHLGDGPAITKIVLTCRADVPGIGADEFAKLANDAKAGCPVSKALAGVGEIVLDAALAG